MKTIIKSLTPLLLVSVIAGLVLAILGPYGTNAVSFTQRLIYWVGLCICGGLGAGLGDFILRALKLAPKPLAVMFVRAFTSALIVFAILAGFSLSQNHSITPSALLATFFYVFVIAFIISFIGYLSESRKAPPIEKLPAPPAILSRLPMHLRSAEIFALTAEDHYVRIITSRGEDMVLMRLADAIAETAPLPGVQIHRSWWVAQAGVAKISKSEIQLKSGQSAPISRSGMARVKEAGWR